MEMLVRRHPHYGYRRIGDLLDREGFRANPNRIYRLWKRGGYRVPRQQHRRRLVSLQCAANTLFL